MLKLRKIRPAYFAPILITLAMGLNGCGEKEMTIPRSLIYSFDHKVPESLRKNPDFTSDEYKPFMREDIFFLGVALGDPNAKTFEIGVQFETKTENRRIFVEKMVLDTPDLKTERVVNEYVAIDLYDQASKIYYRRFSPFENVSEDSIPVTADSFMLRIDYRIDDKPTKQMSIRFENTSFSAPNY